ncbi:zinc finger protein 883-like [Tachysurus ichikawai]
MEIIAQTVSTELREKLKSAEFWGLLFDGSEDITKTEQEIVYIVSVSSSGEFTIDFLGLIELGAKRTARDITEGLVKLFNDLGLDKWRAKLDAVCTNGAAVNVEVLYEAILPLDRDSTIREWMRLKQAGKRLAASSVYDLVKIVNTSDPDCYCNIYKILKLSLTLPLSSAACERGFSHLNIIKNKYRSRLSHTHLSALMHIHLSKMSTDTFEPKPAVELWMQTAHRRLNQGGATTSTAQDAVSSSCTTVEIEDSEEGSEEGSEEDDV